jgi:hypothetical protein
MSSSLFTGDVRELTPEARVSMMTDGSATRGVIDTMFIDNNKVVIGDYKHTKDIDAEAILQQLVYKRIIETAQKETNYGKDTKAVEKITKNIKAKMGQYGVDLSDDEIKTILSKTGGV